MDGPRRRERILDAALHLFATEGIAATGTRQIAEAAGVATGSVFYHFKGKEDLVEAVISRATVAPDLRRIVEQPDRSTRDRLVDAATEFLRTLRERRELLSVVVQAALVDARYRDRLVATLRTETDILVGLLDRTPGATASTTASRALATTLLTGLVTTSLLHPDPTGEDGRTIETTVDLLLDGAALAAAAVRVGPAPGDGTAGDDTAVTSE